LASNPFTKDYFDSQQTIDEVGIGLLRSLSSEGNFNEFHLLIAIVKESKPEFRS
jgi:hypothetical protein